MGYCSFLNINVVPFIFSIVNPCLHGVKKVCLCFRITLCNSVDNSHCFGSCDLLIGSECTVGVSLYPSEFGYTADFVCCPVSVDVAVFCCLVSVLAVDSCADCGKFGSCDIRVGSEASVRISAEYTDVSKCGYCGAIPVGFAYIAEFVFVCFVFSLHVFIEKSVEHCSGFGSCDFSFRSDCTVVVTVYIRDMVFAVEESCVIFSRICYLFFLYSTARFLVAVVLYRCFGGLCARL